MLEDEIWRLSAMTSAFYAAQAGSFSETRQSPWPGWDRLLPFFRGASREGEGEERALRVLDLGCGNLRFEKFLVQCCPALRFDFHAVDNCASLPRDAAALGVRFEDADIVGCLLSGKPLLGTEEGFDAVVAFGLLHHIPTRELRLALLREMSGQVNAGGMLAASFWQFALDAQMERKARLAHADAVAQAPELRDIAWEEGDYLLGWQGKVGVHRFCHSFASEELDALEGALPGMALTARYHADGRTGALNCYLAWRKPR